MMNNVKTGLPQTGTNNCIIILKSQGAVQQQVSNKQGIKTSNTNIKHLKESIVLKSTTANLITVGSSSTVTMQSGDRVTPPASGLVKSPSTSSSSSSSSSNSSSSSSAISSLSDDTANNLYMKPTQSNQRPPQALNICPSIIMNGQIVATTSSAAAISSQTNCLGGVDKRGKQFKVQGQPAQEQESELDRVFRVS